MELLPNELIELGGAGVMLALFLGTFVSEDLACITAGSLIAAHTIDPFAAVFACFAGIVVGDLLLFGAGRFFGRSILESSLAARVIAPAAVDRASEWLSARGTSAIFISRFVSGLRLPTYFLSGVLRLDAKRFALLVAVGAGVWTPVIVFASAFWNTTVPIGAVAAIIVFFLFFQFAFRLTDWRRRRLLAGKIRRVWNWEFWPLWLFYIPVVCYVAWLTIRYRGAHFTAANSGIPASGFVGESKDAIYKLIANSPYSSRHLLRHIHVSKGEKLAEVKTKVDEFLAANGLSFPIVLKPDAGERGNGVKIVRDENDLNAAVQGLESDLLVQEFADGPEVSVFYYRFPSMARGTIFSITEKIFPYVIGDGVSTLEDLILGDPRAHIIADVYFKRNQERLGSIPEEGASVPLVALGSHSQGAIFRDGAWLRTDALEESIDALASRIPGFHFGRFDLRAPSYEALQAGEFRIIELNGVTSESTNIYDPKYSLLGAYRILFDQWRIAFAIGSENAANGGRRSTISDLISLYLKSRRLA